eukprot:m.88243 g.88243  ORF g.88243 m.88243 type:complete len:71 (-) comp21449_c0_seq5:527-739(-)
MVELSDVLSLIGKPSALFLLVFWSPPSLSLLVFKKKLDLANSPGNTPHVGCVYCRHGELFAALVVWVPLL